MQLAVGEQVVGWTVVGSYPVTQLALPESRIKRSGWLLVFVVTSIGLLSIAWHYFVIGRPMRAVAAATAGIVERPGVAISPVRHDEIGAIAMCVEICRQTALHGEHKLAGAERLRGQTAPGEHTAVIPKVMLEQSAGSGGGG